MKAEACWRYWPAGRHVLLAFRLYAKLSGCCMDDMSQSSVHLHIQHSTGKNGNPSQNECFLQDLEVLITFEQSSFTKTPQTQVKVLLLTFQKWMCKLKILGGQDMESLHLIIHNIKEEQSAKESVFIPKNRQSSDNNVDYQLCHWSEHTHTLSPASPSLHGTSEHLFLANPDTVSNSAPPTAADGVTMGYRVVAGYISIPLVRRLFPPRLLRIQRHHTAAALHQLQTEWWQCTNDAS